MIAFILLAAALVIATAAAIAVPLLRGGSGTSRAPWTVLAVVVLLAGGGISLYLTFSNWSWSKAKAAESGPRTMVSRLARTLWHHPDDAKGWMMLGRSYMELQQTPLAVRAYERANHLTGGESPDVLLSLAEALSVEDESQLNGRAGKLIEKALALEPHDPQALFFGAAAAIHRGDLPLARARFTALLALNPPDSVKTLIEQQITAIDQRLAAPGGTGQLAAAGGPGGSPSGSDQAAGATPDAGSASDAASGASGGASEPHPAAAIRIEVALSPKLKGAEVSGAPLYVFVTDRKEPGPPLAVKRLETRFPQSVELTSDDAMIAGHGILPGQDVEVVARIARSGSPIAKKGDPFGEVPYHVARTGTVQVTIDRLTP
jgi:cytochrome c-type biogenesis protein CcmH